jgi:hypothetical protein
MEEDMGTAMGTEAGTTPAVTMRLKKRIVFLRKYSKRDSSVAHFKLMGNERK